MGRIGHSFQLFLAALRVLLKNSDLLFFPLLAGLSTMSIGAVAGYTVWEFAEGTTGKHSIHNIPALGWIVAIGAYLLISYAIIYCNAALIYAADQALRGENPTLATGLRGAGQRAIALAPWAMITSSVWLALRIAEGRVSRVSEIIIKFVGLSWTLASYLVLPMVVLERKSTPQAIKRSSEVIKKTWGDSPLGLTGVGLVSAIGALLALPVVITCSRMDSSVYAASIVGGMLWLLFMGALASSLRGIYVAAVYRFAVDETSPAAFAKLDLSTALRPRQNAAAN